MATYVIGDIHGCFATFVKLLDRVRFDEGNDRLWFVGDLVNRGPRSLEMLRWVRDYEDLCVATLGNHDLHLLGRARGHRLHKVSDTFDELLAAPDAEELLTWLRLRPLLFEEGDFVLVHAGIHPEWSLKNARRHARKAEARLRGEHCGALIDSLYEPDRGFDWNPELKGQERDRASLAVFTRMRTLDTAGRLRLEFTGAPEDAPADLQPWFEGRQSSVEKHTVLFGHWAGLGLHVAPGLLALDSGCVYGGALTAVCLESGRFFQEPLADPVSLS